MNQSNNTATNPEIQMSFPVRLVSLFVMLMVIVSLLRPMKVKIPKKYKIPFIKNGILTLNFTNIPVVGVILLLITTALNFDQLIQSLMGDDHFQPYAIIILFFALAYLCLSIDVTGVFETISIYCINKTNGRTKPLFIVVFILSSLMTLFTSNDISILTITPIICSIANNCPDLDPFPFLILEFQMANIWSIVLFIGNPTNIIVAQANSMSFIEYSKWMALPGIIMGFFCFAALWYIYIRKMPEQIELPKVEPMSLLRDRNGAIYGLIALIICLGFLLTSVWFSLKLWVICAAFAGVLGLKDIFRDMTLGPSFVLQPKEEKKSDQFEMKVPSNLKEEKKNGRQRRCNSKSRTR